MRAVLRGIQNWQSIEMSPAAKELAFCGSRWSSDAHRIELPTTIVCLL